MDEGNGSKSAKFLTLLGRWATEAVIVAIVGFLAGLGGAWIALISKDHELKIRLVEIGVGILRADPEENLFPARRWAVRLVGSNSGQSFSEEEENALVNNKLTYEYIGSSYDYSYTPSYDSTYTPERNHR